jgi:hypothetical protein
MTMEIDEFHERVGEFSRRVAQFIEDDREEMTTVIVAALVDLNAYLAKSCELPLQVLLHANSMAYIQADVPPEPETLQ